jgi:diguanylate cyclase (GGDEF)-like protein
VPGQRIETGMRILIVEDSVEVGKSLCALIGSAHQTTLAASLEEAKEALARETFDAVISDDRLPEPAGVEFLAQVRDQQPMAICLLMSAWVDTDRLLKAINETHVFAFLEKPIPRQLLFSTLSQVAQMRAVMRERDEALSDLKAQKGRLELLVAERTRQLAQQNVQLERLAMRDPLTGLFNRRYIEQRMEEELSRLQRYGAALSILLFDIDNFKAVNDTHGHAVGDKILKQVATTFVDSVRQVDLVARFGGEEFLLLLPNTGLEPAELTGARLCKQIAAASKVVTDDGLTVSVTVSGGVSSARADDKGWKATVERADSALYEAKAAGKNRTMTG